MKIGLVDCDSHNFPNLPLMKLSAYHKKAGDCVSFARMEESYDLLYVSKIFTEFPEPVLPVCGQVIRGGSGYDIENKLPEEIEHIYPDYTLYPELTRNTAYGFLTRGCPRRNHTFCITPQKDGCVSQKAADLSEFWNGQGNIILLDQNILACKERMGLLCQLADSGALVEFNGGMDIRFLNEPVIEALKKIRVKNYHFAWDDPREKLQEKFRLFQGSGLKVSGHCRVYTLREELAPYGYLQAEEITFTVEDTAEIQKVEMKDAVPKGLLLINKEGEFLEDVSALDSIGGWIAHLFEYVSGSLKDVTFEVYALEDIKAADGESADHYKKDELIAELTTDDTGVASLGNLPLGKYYVKEKETANGYVLDGEIREIDLTYRDQHTAEVTYSSDWQNNRQKVEVSVLKKEKDSDRVLEGAVFALSAKEDITNKDGKVIMEAGTVIEEKATDKDGKLTFAADLPIGFSYTVKETVPAPGFATVSEAQEFTFTYEDSQKETVFYELTFEDEPTVFEFTKTSLTDGKEVEGAKLQVTDENGKVVDEWVSGKEPHIIKELTVGKEYTMTEVLPADGYATAENITFTVEDTAEVQKIEMKDDVTKVEITKTDLTDGKELPGAKLKVTDSEGKVIDEWTSGKEPHRIEKLVVGKEYVLTETLPADGYVTAESITFTVEDTAEVQKIEMKDDVTKVEISKTDISGKELPGAKLAILDKDGKAVESWTSTDKPYYIEKLPVGKYTLREESAPEGYLVAEDVEFEVKDTGEIQKVVMKDEAKPEETPETPQPSNGTPKTGDDTHAGLWLLLCGLALAGLAGSVVLLRRKKK